MSPVGAAGRGHSCPLPPHAACAQAALPHLQKGASIINTSSVTAYQGSSKLVPYSASKGAQARTQISSNPGCLAEALRPTF
jgi:NAD(P)-dependent dehydrogenase (short-subunit alcohol dehydrogenase family)